MENQLLDAWNMMFIKLGEWLNALVLNLPNFIIAIIVFAIVIFASKYFRKLSYKLLDKTELQPSMKNLISKLTSAFVILFGLFLILGILNLGKTLNTILAGAGVVGLAVGLALQGALANTYSGIILSFVKFVKFGDWIETNGYEREVLGLDLRVVTLKQNDNNLVYIPNKMVVENSIKNFSQTAQSKVILTCGVGYSSDLEFVRELTINTMIDNIEPVEEKSDVIFLYTEFGGSSINFELRFWINSTSSLEVLKAKSTAIIAIKKAFDKNDINIPFPIRTLDIPNLKIGNKELITAG